MTDAFPVKKLEEGGGVRGGKGGWCLGMCSVVKEIVVYSAMCVDEYFKDPLIK